MRKWFGATSAVLALCLATACNAQQPLSQSAFRDVVARELSGQQPGLCVRPDGDSSLKVGRSPQTCGEMDVNTAYIYQQYLSDPAHQDEYVAQLVTMALNGIGSLEAPAFTPDRNRIVAVLRPDAYVVSTGERGNRESSIWRPFAGDFIVMLGHDEDGQIRSLRGIDLEGIGLSEEEAWLTAISNLRDRIGTLDRIRNAAGAEHVSARSGLANSHLLLPETCTASSPDFDVFIVARDSFFYADASMPDATVMLAGYAAELLQDGQEAYSHRLLSCLDGAWYASVFNGTNAWLPEQ